jgi:hypothetical protein
MYNACSKRNNTNVSSLNPSSMGEKQRRTLRLNVATALPIHLQHSPSRKTYVRESVTGAHCFHRFALVSGFLHNVDQFFQVLWLFSVEASWYTTK